MIGRSMDDDSTEPVCIPSRHARMRMSARRIPPRLVVLAKRFGRRVHVGAAILYVVGRREVARPGFPVADRRALEGLHVLCPPDDGPEVITVYRNRSLAGLRAAVRRARRRRNSRRTLNRTRRRRRY